MAAPMETNNLENVRDTIYVPPAAKRQKTEPREVFRSGYCRQSGEWPETSIEEIRCSCAELTQVDHNRTSGPLLSPQFKSPVSRRSARIAFMGESSAKAATSRITFGST
jgi:hypothetical protein